MIDEEAGSWVTAKVHQRIDSLWKPWHTVSYGPVSHGIARAQACSTRQKQQIVFHF